MKKTIIISTLVGVLCFVLGMSAGWHGCKSYNRSNKIEIVKAQDAALKAADKVMDNNQLFDTDGSDAMADYLQKAAVVDSLHNLGNQGLCSSFSKQQCREYHEPQPDQLQSCDSGILSINLNTL